MYAPTSIVVVLLAGALTGCAGVVHVGAEDQPERDGYDINFREAPSQRELPGDNNATGSKRDGSRIDASESSSGAIRLDAVGGLGTDPAWIFLWQCEGVYPVVPRRWVDFDCGGGRVLSLSQPDSYMVVPAHVRRGDSVPRVEAVAQPEKREDKTIYYLCGLIVVCALIIAVLTW